MQISSKARTVALGTVAGVSLALSGTALAVAVSGDEHQGDGPRQAAFASHQDGGRGGAMGPGGGQGFGGPQQGGPQDRQQGGGQGYGDQQSAGPAMQSGAS